MNANNQIYNLRLNETQEISIKVPAQWNLLGKLIPKNLTNSIHFKEKLEQALNNPYNSERLDTLLEGKKNVLIISDDQTRPTPVYDIISFLIEKFNSIGICNNKIKVIIGKGLHPKPNEGELLKKFKDLSNKTTLIIHDPDKDFAHIGETSFKVPVEINKEVINADFRISLGTIKPHEMTGFSGGAAIIVPGVASRKTIRYNHSLLFKTKENSYFGRVEGNPVRNDMEEAAKMANLDFIINVILNNDGNVCDFFVGDFLLAHKKGTERYKENFGVKVREKADLCIVSAFPRHKTIGKGLKALFLADVLIKKEGSIICYIDGEDGISSSEVFEDLLLKNLSISELFTLLKKSELPGEACILYLFSKIKQKKIIIVTRDEYRTNILKMGLTHAKNFEDAINLLDKKLIKTYYIIPNGINLYPII